VIVCVACSGKVMGAVDSTALSAVPSLDPELDGDADASAEDAVAENTDLETAAERLRLGQVQKLIFIQQNDPATRVDREHELVL
jgi:hypothetical protein